MRANSLSNLLQRYNHLRALCKFFSKKIINTLSNASPYCHYSYYHPIGKTTFNVIRQARAEKFTFMPSPNGVLQKQRRENDRCIEYASNLPPICHLHIWRYSVTVVTVVFYAIHNLSYNFIYIYIIYKYKIYFSTFVKDKIEL